MAGTNDTFGAMSGLALLGSLTWIENVGAASLPYVNAPEARILTGREPTDPAWVEAHAEGLVATLLPNRRTRTRRERTRG